jgi:hypothetical protein
VRNSLMMKAFSAISYNTEGNVCGKLFLFNCRCRHLSVYEHPTCTHSYVHSLYLFVA